MKLDRKFEIATQAINSIARHDDEEEGTVMATLDVLSEHIAKERAAHTQRKAARRQAAVAALTPAQE
jgi:hypothetical protein